MDKDHPGPLPDDVRVRVATWERHIQSALLALSLMFAGWMANYVWDSRSQDVDTAGKLSFLTQQVGELKGLVQAMQTNYVAREDFRDHETRLRLIEQAQRRQR